MAEQTRCGLSPSHPDRWRRAGENDRGEAPADALPGMVQFWVTGRALRRGQDVDNWNDEAQLRFACGVR